MTTTATRRLHPTPGRTSVRAWVTRHPLVAFFAFAYTFTWIFWTPAALDVGGALGQAGFFVGAWGPALGAALVTWYTGGSLRDWAHPIVRWRVPVHWYVVALGIPPLLMLIPGVMLIVLRGETDFSLIPGNLVGFLPSLLVVMLLGGGRGWTVPAGFAMLTLVFFAGEMANSGFSADWPRPNQIQYTLDADSGQAHWQSAATEPDGWTDQFFTGGYTKDKDALPRGAYAAHLDMTLPGDLIAATIAGHTVDIATGPMNDNYVIPAGTRRLPLMVHNLPAEGLEVTLAVQGTGPIGVALQDFSNGLPAVPGLTVTPRSPEFMPAPYDFRDPTVVRRSFVLGGY
jgi:hypothetical protein